MGGVLVFLLIFAIGVIALAYTSVVTNNIVRVTIGAVDITMGVLTLMYPEWSLREYSGLSLPYYFEDQYDGQTYEDWDGYGESPDIEQ